MEALTAIWADLQSAVSAGPLGAGLGHTLLALAVLAACVLLRGVFTRFVLGILGRIVARTKSTWDDELLLALEPPLRMTFIVVGIAISAKVMPLTEQVELFAVRLVRSLFAIVIFWTLYRAVTPFSFLLDRAFKAVGDTDIGASLQDFFAKMARFVIVCVGIAAVMEEWGFNISAVLGGLGLVGMAAAFGAQNLIANLFGGLSIFFDKVFQTGDWIRTAEVEGVVEDIGFRTTKIRRFDKALTVIPNSKLSDEALVNFSRMTNRRIYWKIGVVYGTSEAQLRQVVNGIHDYVFASPDFETEPSRVTTLIHVDSFNSSSIDIMLYCFTKTTKWGEWMEAKERLTYQVKQIVEQAGTSFAFPSTSVYLESLPFGTPEVFPASADAAPRGADAAAASQPAAPPAPAAPGADGPGP